MESNENTCKPTLPIAVVGKSAFFPASGSSKAFWPAVLGLDGVLPGLIASEWPFGEFLPKEDLKKLKGFFMESGLLASGEIPAAGFDIPREILKIADVLPILSLFLARQALEGTDSFKSGKVKPAAVKIMLGVIGESPVACDWHDRWSRRAWSEVLREQGVAEAEVNRFADLVETTGRIPPKAGVDFSLTGSISQAFARRFGCDVLTLNGSLPLRTVSGFISEAVRELSHGTADLVVVGGIDGMNPAFSALSLSGSTVPGTVSQLSEGLGIIALRRLEDAQRDGDTIHAILEGALAGSLTFRRSNQAVGASPAPDSSPTPSVQGAPPAISLAQFARLNPEDLVVDPATKECTNLPYNIIPDSLPIGASPQLNWKKVREHWLQTTGPRRFFHDILGTLFGTFVSRIVIQSPREFDVVKKRPVMYMGNHQIGLESPLFMALSVALSGITIQAVAKPDHVNAWLSFLMAFADDSLGDNHPFRLVYFDKAQPMSLIEFLKRPDSLNASLLVHVEGTRSREAGQPVTKLSSVFLDVAVEKGIPIVPIRFVGGLPPQRSEEGLDFPYGNGKQDFFLGTPISADELKNMPYGQRPRFVMGKINSLGPGTREEDILIAPHPKFEEKTRFYAKNLGMPKMQAMLFAVLGLIDDPCEETAILMKAVQTGNLSGSGSIPPVLQKFLAHVKTKFK